MMKIIKERSSCKGFPYMAYIPEEVSEKPALLIQLHGAGERGEGDNLDVVTVNGFAGIVTDQNLKDCILLMPQCPKNSFWVAKIESLKAFIDKMMEELGADPNRIYLCGMSMGGFGTWYTAMAYPETFAAIAPCCGGGMAWNSGVLKMPIRTFHGLKDTIVSPQHTIDMKNALQGWHPDFECTLYEDVEHNSWIRAFDEKLLNWFLGQKK